MHSLIYECMNTYMLKFSFLCENFLNDEKWEYPCQHPQSNLCVSTVVMLTIYFWREKLRGIKIFWSNDYQKITQRLSFKVLPPLLLFPSSKKLYLQIYLKNFFFLYHQKAIETLGKLEKAILTNYRTYNYM